jgi:hypothetical protein
MQEHHSATLVKIKQHPSDAVLSQVRPYLVNTTAYGAAYRHTHRPAKLDGLDVLADPLAVLAGREAFQPFPNRLSAGLSPKKTALTRLPCRSASGLSSPWDCLWISATTYCTTYGTQACLFFAAWESFDKLWHIACGYALSFETVCVSAQHTAEAKARGSPTNPTPSFPEQESVPLPDEDGQTE